MTVLKPWALVALALFAVSSCRGCDPPMTEEFLNLDEPRERGEIQMELARSRSPLPLAPAHIEVEIGTTGVAVAGNHVVDIADGGAVYVGTPMTTWEYHIQPIWEPVNERSLALEAAEGNNCCAGPWGIATVAAHQDTSFGLLTRVLSTIGQSRLISYQMLVESPEGERRGIRICQVRYDSGCSRCWRDHWERLGWRQRPFRSVLDPEPDAGAEERPLNLMVLLVSDGFLLITTPPRDSAYEEDAGRIHIPLLSSDGASCRSESDPDEPCDAPRPACRRDLESLHRHIAAIKSEHPTELAAIISACNWVKWGELVSVIDVIQGTAEEPLFPLIVFTSGLM